MTTTVYALGLPTKAAFATAELSDFINDGIPTLYITMTKWREQFDGYNFYEENNFEHIGRYTTEVTAERIQNSEKRLLCAFPINPFDFYTSSEAAVVALPQRVGQRINRILNEISQELPGIRIAFCTWGSPWLCNRSVLSALNATNCPFSWQVLDVQSHDDPNSNKFYRAGFVIYGVLPQNSYKRLPIDRSGGIFFPSDIPADLRIPEDTHTDLTYAQIVDETALTYAGRTPIVAWSGGIDSTVIVAAFIKNNVDFKVSVGKSTLKENPELHAYLVANYNTIELPDDNDFSNIADTSSVIVTGEPNGHLFPRLKPNFMLGSTEHFNHIITSSETIDPAQHADKLLIDVPAEYLYNNVRESFIRNYIKTFRSTETEAAALYDDYLKPKLDQFPFEVRHYYQLIFFFKLIFGYQEVLIEPFIRGSKCKNPAVPFFHTPNFQRWAITNMDTNFETQCTNYQTEKTICKQYIYDVIPMPSQLQLHKYPSQLSLDMYPLI